MILQTSMCSVKKNKNLDPSDEIVKSSMTRVNFHMNRNPIKIIVAMKVFSLHYNENLPLRDQHSNIERNLNVFPFSEFGALNCLLVSNLFNA